MVGGVSTATETDCAVTDPPGFMTGHLGRKSALACPRPPGALASHRPLHPRVAFAQTEPRHLQEDVCVCGSLEPWGASSPQGVFTSG